MDALIGLVVTLGFLALPVALVVAALSGPRCSCRYAYRSHVRIQSASCKAHLVKVPAEPQGIDQDWLGGGR